MYEWKYTVFVLLTIAFAAPGDYDAIDEDLIFSGGVTSRSVTVRANSDMLDDPNEQFQLLLVDTLTLVVMSTATVIIINGRTFCFMSLCD